MLCTKTGGLLGAAALAAAMSASAYGVNLEGGFYALSNHPDGSENPPAYGMRLDGLNGDTSEEFTFNFDHAESAMWLTLTGSGPSSWNIRISGDTWGGRDVGTEYADDEWRGVYEVEFNYLLSVQDVPGDDDIWVVSNSGDNSGTILAPNGNLYNLEDKSNGSFAFRLGDEDDDNGHRGFDGISGWGWLMHAPADGRTDPQNIPYSDWLFTAEKSDIPAPGSMGLAAAALGLAGVRRRRR